LNGGILFIFDSLRFVLDFVDILSFQILIEAVLNLTHGPTEQQLHLRNLRPFGTDLIVHFEDELIFLTGPLPADDGGVNNVVPPLPTLAPKAVR